MRAPFHPSISATIVGAFLTLGVLTAAIGGYGLFVLQAAGGFVVDLYDGPLMAINFDRAASLDFLEMDRELVRRAGTHGAAGEAIDTRIAHLAKTFDDDLAVAAARTRYSEEQAVIAEVQGLVAQWHQLRLAGPSLPAAEAAGDRAGEFQQLAARILERFDALAELAAEHSFVERRKVVTAISLFKISSFAVLLAALLLAAGIAVMLVRRIIKPLRSAAAIADRIAAGELQTPIPEAGPDETGLLLRSIAVMQRNIHEMVEREKAQRRSAQNRLVEAIESSHEAVALVDGDSRIVIANRRLADFFPMIAASGSGSAGHIVPLGEANRLLLPDGPRDPGDNPGAAAVERELSLPDGRWVRISRSRTQEGGFFVVVSDISDIKEREQRLDEARHAAEAASAAKSSFVANMSHELRTPLNAIIGFSEIMAAELYGRLGNDHYVQYARDIAHSGSHLLAIINSVLDLSKSEAGKLQLACEHVHLREIIDSSATIMRQQCARAGLRLSIEVAEAPLLLWADPAKLRQVLLNLMSNAVKFTDPGGAITVAAAVVADGGVVVSVSDTGIGMSADQIPTAFAPFGQVDSRLSRRYEGTGLGLPLSKAIVELHGGAIAIVSRPGSGTTVTVTLPPATATATDTATAAAA